MDKEEREAIAKRALAHSTADQTEVAITYGDRALTRFTRGISNQNVRACDTSISVRAIVGGRTGVAASNALDDASLREVVARAIELATFAPVDPGQPLLGSGGPAGAPAGSYLEDTARAGAERRATICDALMGEADAAGFWSAGFVSTSSEGYTCANSSGTLSSFDGSDSSANVKMTAADSTGFAECHANDVARIDGAAIGKRAAEKARASAAPRSVAPGDWTVILEPSAFGELLAYLISHFSAQAYDEGSSFFSGDLGSKYLSPALTIYDDYAHPLAPSMPFDYEGQPKQRVTLVESGTVRNFVTDGYYAHKLGLANTGHALPAPNSDGPQALNVVVAPGTASGEDLIAQTERGILITRFWYIRTVDRKRAIVTGMTRDGTFLIENGRLTGGIKNLRFNQSIVEALQQITVGNDQARTGGYAYSLVAPTVKLEKFSFTSGTEF